MTDRRAAIDQQDIIYFSQRRFLHFTANALPPAHQINFDQMDVGRQQG